MNILKREQVWCRSIIVTVLLVWCAPVMAQLNAGGRTALENARRPSVLPDRAPGDLVGAGLFRAQQAIPLGRTGVNITETARSLSFGTAFLVDAIGIVFDDVNLFLPFFEDLILARAGFGAAPTGVAGESAMTNAGSQPVDQNDPAATGDPAATVDPADPPAAGGENVVDENAGATDIPAQGGAPAGDLNPGAAKRRKVRSLDPR